ncbi:MAG: DNA polymerase III subunit delta [Bauldia sp.]
MVDVKPANAERLLAAPDPAIRVILLYGPDDGLVAERASGFVKAVTGASDDPFSHVRLEAAELADDPARLADEAHAVPLFGGRRAITVRLSGSRSILPALEPILEAPPIDSWIVVTAGELKKTAPLRKLCESSPRAAAIPCYADSAKDLDRIIDEETKRAGLAISGDARTMLRGLLGSDRLASRSEVLKLCLYAADKGSIDVDDVAAIIGDAAAFEVDEAIDALALGDADGFDRTWRRLVASGTPGFVICGAAQRHFTQLHQARAALDNGRSAEAAIAAMRPPVFFQRKARVERQVTMWPLARIERTLEHLDRAMIDSRLRGTISDDVIGEALTLVTAMAASLRRR